MKDKTIICKFYTYAGGPCDKRGINVWFNSECQTCKKYEPLAGARSAKPDLRKKKKEDALRKERY